ncbi:MAG: DUF3385 domain-containing protein, partial [Flavobacteriaceae bacterium]|nr:DUF3385 domain-containing protein [Flavobacteriaceae bacterium]
DADSDIRLSTLELLAEEFDQTLALQDCIRSLVPALNDKHANRQAAVRLLGRLSRRNAGCVLPVLRKVMVQCTTELEHFNSDKKQEHATSILGTLIEAAPALIRPYTQSLMSLCVVRLNDDHVAPNVLTALLSCVGKLVQHVSGPELEAARRLKGLIVRHITDSSSTQEKQEAIRALGSIIRATADVTVYDQFPQLLPSLLSTLHGGFKEAWPVRKDVLTLMGIIGAVDPVKVKSLSRNLELEKGTDSNDPIAISRTRGDDVMAHIVVAAILEVLQMVSTESSDERCSSAVSALVEIFSSRTMKLSTVVAYMPRVIPELLRHIRSQARMRERLFRELTTLVSVVK